MSESGDVERQLIRRARGKFAAMVGAYAFGVFNDNFFKQAASLMALSAGLGKLQGVAAAAFSVPFMLFAAPAGWLADRFPKRSIVIAAKIMEVLAMIAGAWGICAGSWTLIMLMVFTMGLQATIFSPALNGSIPELYPEGYVLKANSIVKMITTAAILLGIILAGQPLNYKEPAWQSVPLGHWLVAGGVLAVSLAGLIASLFVPSRPAADPAAKFPWSGPWDTARVLWGLRHDRLLSVVVWADAAVWFLAVLQILLINKIGRLQFGLSEGSTSTLAVAELAGVAVGGLVCGRLASSATWHRVLAPGAITLAGAMLLMAAVPALPARAADLPIRMPAVLAVLLLAGLAGGILLVPLESFIQTRPSAERKGQVIAAANFAAFAAMSLAGLAFILLDQEWLAATNAFAWQAVPTVLLAVWLRRVLPRT